MKKNRLIFWTRLKALRLLIIPLLTCYFIISCVEEDQPKNNNDKISNNTLNSNFQDKLKKELYNTGDTIIYQNLLVEYLNHRTGDLLFWSLIMANKFDYSEAYINVFQEIHGVMWEMYYDGDTIIVDKETDYFLRKYLDCSSVNGNERAEELLYKYNKECFVDTGCCQINSSKHIYSDREKIFYLGDTTAYFNLKNTYSLNQEDFLVWAILMANRHSYSRACADIQDILFLGLKKYGANDVIMDSKTLEIIDFFKEREKAFLLAP